MKKRILIVDDDVCIGDLLEELLTGAGYDALRAYSGTEALLVLERARPDLILLDRMLPGLNGDELLHRIQGVPVIILSAKADVQGKVDLLLGGAADYITKPFDTKELLARVAVQLRRAAEGAPDAMLRAGSLQLDAAAHLLCVEGGAAQVRLTRTECAILKLLMRNPGQVIAKSAILDRISLDTPDCTDASLKQHVSNLRKKLREAGAGDPIEAVWGIGFRLVADAPA